MRRGQTLRDLAPIVDGFTDRQPGASPVEHLPQRLSFDQLGDEKRGAVVLPDVVDREEIRMIERAKRAPCSNRRSRSES